MLAPDTFIIWQGFVPNQRRPLRLNDDVSSPSSWYAHRSCNCTLYTERSPMSPSKLASLFLLLTLLWASATFSAQAAVLPDAAPTSDAALLRQLSQASGGDARI